MTAMGFPASPSNGDTYEKWTYDAASGSWVINEGTLSLSGSTTDDLTEGSSNLYYTNARWDSDLDSAISAGKIVVPSSLSSTDSLNEGSVNLYYTQARAQTDFDSGFATKLLDEDTMVSDDPAKAPSQQSVKAYVDNSISAISGLTVSNFDPSAIELSSETFVDNDTSLMTAAAIDDRITARAISTTDSLNEGTTNLYYTNARFDSDLDSAIQAGKIVVPSSLSSTDSLNEGTTNLYYTNARFDSDLDSALQAGKITTGVIFSATAPPAPTEGSMWYRTDSNVVMIYDGSFWADFPLNVTPSFNTDKMFEGNNNKFYTNSRFDSDLDSAIGAGKVSASIWKENGSNTYYDAGNVGIGISSPDELLHIKGNDVAIKLEDLSAPQTFSIQSTGGNLVIIDVNNTDEIFRLTASGTIHVDEDVVAFSSTTSDARFKNQVEVISNPLSKVQSLRGVEYTWNSGSRKGQRDMGFIAQEVEEVVPHIVRERALVTASWGTDENGNDIVAKTIDYEKLTGLLVEAIKELAERVNELEKGNEE